VKPSLLDPRSSQINIPHLEEMHTNQFRGLTALLNRVTNAQKRKYDRTLDRGSMIPASQPMNLGSAVLVPVTLRRRSSPSPFITRGSGSATLYSNLLSLASLAKTLNRPPGHGATLNGASRQECVPPDDGVNAMRNTSLLVRRFHTIMV
jgi:hypothetical protein